MEIKEIRNCIVFYFKKSKEELSNYQIKVIAYSLRVKYKLPYNEISKLLRVKCSHVYYAISYAKKMLKSGHKIIYDIFDFMEALSRAFLPKEHGFKSKCGAEVSAGRINKMLGLPLREGFHIMRVFEKDNLWYLSRYYG